MQRVWCTKCGRNNVAGCQLCGGCGERLRPCLLNAQPGGQDAIACTNCGTLNRGDASLCVNCGFPIFRTPNIGGGEAPRGDRSGRISLRPEAAEPAPENKPAGGAGRLSRLAEARRQKEAAEGRSSQDSSDWLGGLRSDAPPPMDYATGMDEDDEVDPTLNAVLEELRQDETAEGAYEATNPSFSLFDEPATLPGSAERPSFEDNQPSFSKSEDEDNEAAEAAATPPRLPLPSLDDFELPASPEPPARTSFDSSFLDELSATSKPFRLEDSLPSSFSSSSLSNDNPLIGSVNDESMPDWLTELSGPDTNSNPTSFPLSGFGTKPFAPSNFAGAEPSKPKADEVPDWLRELTEPAPPASSEAEATAPETPALLGTLGTTDSSEMPDWLQDIQPTPFSPGDNPIEALPAWLHQTTNTLPSPSKPSFGDADVEERLSFAFDEPVEMTRPSELSNIPPARNDSSQPLSGRGHTGLTDILGLPPLRDDDAASLSPAPPPPPNAAREEFGLPDFLQGFGTPASSANGSDLVPWLQGLRPPILEEDQEEASTPSAASVDLDFLTGLGEPASQSQVVEATAKALTTNALVPWLQGMPIPSLEEFADQRQVAGDDGGATIAVAGVAPVALPDFDLPDFLAFEPAPTRPEQFSPAGPSPVDLPNFLDSLTPSQSAAIIPKEELTNQVADETLPRIGDNINTDSRSFSVRDMFRATDALSSQFLSEQEADAAASPVDDFGLPGLPSLGSLNDETSQYALASGLDDDTLPNWLQSDAGPAAPPSAPPPSVSYYSPYDDTNEAEEGEDTEILPFSTPGFSGPAYESAAHSSQPSLSSLTGKTPEEFELPSFFSDASSPGFAAAEPALPDFLRDTGATAATPAQPVFSPPAELPYFLQDTSASPAPSELDLPDFLKDMGSTSQPSFVQPPAQAEPELPDFLRDMGAASAPSFASPPAQAEPELPDFLRDMGATATPSAAQADPEMPDWLRGLGGSSQPAPAQAEPELPDFLRDMASPAQAMPQSTPPVSDFDLNFLGLEAAQEAGPPAQATPGNGDSLDFLRSEADAVEASSQPEEDAPMPSWLEALSKGTGAAELPRPKATTSYSPMGMGVSRAEEQQSELPEWLQEEETAQSAPVQPFAPSASPMPDFFNDASASASPVPDFAEVEAPDWLRGATASSSVPTPAQAEPEMPDFLKEMTATAAPLTPSEVSREPNADFGAFAAEETPPIRPLQSPAQDEQELPRLLRDLENSTSDLAPNAELPDWLRENSARSQTEPDFAISGELPDWLNENEQSDAPRPLALDDLTLDPATQQKVPPPEFGAASSGGLASNLPGQFNDSNFFGDIEGPAWLRSAAQPRPQTDNLPMAAAPEAGISPLLPNWLRTVTPATVEEETALATPQVSLPLAEAEQSLPQVALPPQLASAAVLSALLASNAAGVASPQPMATTKAASRPKAGWAQPAGLVRYALYALLLLVALFALVSPLPTVRPAVTPGVQTFYGQVEELGPNSKVLIAYDWEAERSGEMRPLAKAVTQHVMSKRARLLAVSLNPQGPALASQITDELATSAYGNSSYRYGTNYLNLGWRTGNEAALFGLYNRLGELTDYKEGQPVSSRTALMQGINSLADFDLIVVLAGDEGGVRTWAEQVGVRPGSRLLFGTPLAVEPLARPYAIVPNTSPDVLSGEKQPRARALLAGLSQTAQYDQLLRDKNITTDQSASLQNRLSAQSLAALLLILIVVGANIYYLARRRG